VFLISSVSRVFTTARVASGKKTGRGIDSPVMVLKCVGLAIWVLYRKTPLAAALLVCGFTNSLVEFDEEGNDKRAPKNVDHMIEACQNAATCERYYY